MSPPSASLAHELSFIYQTHNEANLPQSHWFVHSSVMPAAGRPTDLSTDQRIASWSREMLYSMKGGHQLESSSNTTPRQRQATPRQAPHWDPPQFQMPPLLPPLPPSSSLLQQTPLIPKPHQLHKAVQNMHLQPPPSRAQSKPRMHQHATTMTTTQLAHMVCESDLMSMLVWQ